MPLANLEFFAEAGQLWQVHPLSRPKKLSPVHLNRCREQSETVVCEGTRLTSRKPLCSLGWLKRSLLCTV